MDTVLKGEKPTENNTSTVKQPVVVNENPKTKASIALHYAIFDLLQLDMLKQLLRSIRQVISLGLAIRMLFLLGVAM